MSSGIPCPFACFLRVPRLRAVIPLCTAHPLKRKVTLIHYRFMNSKTLQWEMERLGIGLDTSEVFSNWP